MYVRPQNACRIGDSRRFSTCCLIALLFIVVVGDRAFAANPACADMNFNQLRLLLADANRIDVRSVTEFLPGGSDAQFALRLRYNENEKEKSGIRVFQTNGGDTKSFEGQEQRVVSIKPRPDALLPEFGKDATLIQFMVPDTGFPLWGNRTFVVVACASDSKVKWGLVRARVSSRLAVVIVCIGAIALLYVLVTVAVTAIRNRNHPLGAKYPAYQQERKFVFSQMLDPVRLTADVFNRASVQKLQILMFSLLVAGMLLGLVLRIGLLSDLSTTVLGLLGISGVGAAVAQATSTTRTRLSFENWVWLVRRGIVPINQADHAGPSWGDLVLTNREFDIYKLQTILFSLVVATALIVAGGDRLASFTVPETLLGVLGLSQIVYLGGVLARPRSVGELDDGLSELRKREDTLRVAVNYDTDTDPEGRFPDQLPKEPVIPRPSLETTKARNALARYREQAKQVTTMIESILEIDVDERKLFVPEMS